MSKQHLKYILALLLFSGIVLPQAKAQDLKPEARLEKVSIPLGEQTVLHLSVRFNVKDSVTFPSLKDTLTGKVLVTDVKTDTTFNKDDISIETISKHITLTSFDPGTYTIPPFVFHTKKGDFNTRELTLQVLPVQVDTTKAIYDIKQPLQVKYSVLDWIKDHWLWLAAALLLIVLIYLAVRYMKNRPEKAEKQPEPKMIVPEHETALTKLRLLREKKLWQQEMVKEYYIELTDILREYLEKRFRIKAFEHTTEEILASLRTADIDQESRTNLREVLTLADMVKFAKGKPLPAENDRSFESSVDFVTRTQRMTEASANKPEASANKEDKRNDGLA